MSIGAQTFNTALLDVLDRRAQPDDVRLAVHRLRDAGIDNISLDLIYGIPGQSPADLARDLDEALALEPEHISAYELEAKPGTRFTHAHGAELLRQADALESYVELVVETADRGRVPLVRDGELLPAPRARGRAGPARAAQPRLLARARLPRPRRGRGQHNREPALAERTVAPPLPRGARPAASGRSARWRRCRRATRATERVMLGLRLDEPLPLAGLGHVRRRRGTRPPRGGRAGRPPRGRRSRSARAAGCSEAA